MLDSGRVVKVFILTTVVDAGDQGGGFFFYRTDLLAGPFGSLLLWNFSLPNVLTVLPGKKLLHSIVK